MWMEGRGKWLYVRQGSARVPCYKGYGSTFVVLRVPFRKNGGGLHLNQYAATLFCKLSNACIRSPRRPDSSSPQVHGHPLLQALGGSDAWPPVHCRLGSMECDAGECY